MKDLSLPESRISLHLIAVADAAGLTTRFSDSDQQFSASAFGKGFGPLLLVLVHYWGPHPIRVPQSISLSTELVDLNKDLRCDCYKVGAASNLWPACYPIPGVL